MAVHMLIFATPIIAENCIRLCAGMISLYFHLSEFPRRLQMRMPPLAFHMDLINACCFLLSIRATDPTKPRSRSMSPFVTCHWGTSRAAGTPSGELGQEGLPQLPVSGRSPRLSNAAPLGPATQMYPFSCLGGCDL